MKSLVVLVLAAISVQAQNPNLAEAARQERARRAAQAQQSRVFVNEPTAPPPAASSASDATGEKAVAGKPTAGKTVAPAATPAADTPDPKVEALKQYNEKLQALRARIRELQDQETALTLQMNDLTNQFFSPVTDTDAQARAQSRIAAAQKQLLDIRTETAQTRVSLEQLELQGPPKN